MKRALPIFLLVLFITNTIGSVLLLIIDRHEIRKEVLKWLVTADEHRQVTELQFDHVSFAKIRWIDKDREFVLEGNLYDVVSISRLDGNKVMIRCYHDHPESQVHIKLGEALGLASPGNAHQPFLLSFFKFISGLVPQAAQGFPDISFADGNLLSLLLLPDAVPSGRTVFHPPDPLIL